MLPFLSKQLDKNFLGYVYINVLIITTLQASSYPKRAEQRQERFYKTLVYFSSKYLLFHLLTQ